MSVREHYEQIHTQKFENLDQVNHFLKKHKLLTLTQNKVDNLNNMITTKKIKCVIKYPTPPSNTYRSKYFTGEFYHMFKELTSILYSFFQEIEKKGILPNFFYEAIITLILKPKQMPKRKKKTTGQYIHKYKYKIHNKILASKIQQYIQRIVHHV